MIIIDYKNKKEKKKETRNDINNQRQNVHSDQRSLTFRVGHCHM